MRDTELYFYLLGLKSPWSVDRVDLSVEKQRVDVWAVHPDDTKFPCPECGKACGVYDHAEERTWRHLDSCGLATYLHAAPPRVRCTSHGVRQPVVPWAEPHSRFTMLYEAMAINLLKACTVNEARTLLKLSWDEVWHILEKAVARGMARKRKLVIPYLGADEKAIAKRHRYLTLVYDLERGTVEYIAEGRANDSLARYFQALTPQQLGGILGICIDMWPAFIEAIRAHLANADSKIVFDPYHIMVHMNKAVDAVRKAEHKTLMAEGVDLLKNTKFWWLHARENVPKKNADLFSMLRDMHLATGRAWSIKELLRDLWRCARRDDGLRLFKRWYAWAVRSRLAPVKVAAKTVKRHLWGILNWFEHRISNGMSEGINGLIEKVKVAARGYRNTENFKTVIYFHFGGLDLYPQTHGNPG